MNLEPYFPKYVDLFITYIGEYETEVNNDFTDLHIQEIICYIEAFDEFVMSLSLPRLA